MNRYRPLYLAAYDISSPSRLSHALRILLDYAQGRQKSVFECPLNLKERQALLDRMTSVLNLDEDRFALVRMDRSCASHCLGKAVPLEQGNCFYVG